MWAHPTHNHKTTLQITSESECYIPYIRDTTKYHHTGQERGYKTLCTYFNSTISQDERTTTNKTKYQREPPTTIQDDIKRYILQLYTLQ